MNEEKRTSKARIQGGNAVYVLVDNYKGIKDAIKTLL